MRIKKVIVSLCAAVVLTSAVVPLFAQSAEAAGASDIVYSWHNNTKNIALTFDDGPHPVHTQEILDILAEYDIKATFFVIGQNAGWYSDLVKAEYEAGHEIGNHTFSHPMNLKKYSYDGIKNEFKKAEQAINDSVDCKIKLLRPPGGIYGDTLCKAAADLGYTIICWSIDTRDWAHTPKDEIVKNVLSSVKDGDIILFHDYVANESPTPDALREIIPVLLDEGYNFVTVSELMEAE